MPDGFYYFDKFLSQPQHDTLLSEIEALPWHEVRGQIMRGRETKRKTIQFGAFFNIAARRTVAPAPELPPYLRDLRDRCVLAEAAVVPEIQTADFVQAIVTRYVPDAAIGEHVDAKDFGPVVLGVSLKAACSMMFQSCDNDKLTSRHLLCPCSLYILSRAARWNWKHSTCKATKTRYSITIRSMA